MEVPESSVFKTITKCSAQRSVPVNLILLISVVFMYRKLSEVAITARKRENIHCSCASTSSIRSKKIY